MCLSYRISKLRGIRNGSLLHFGILTSKKQKWTLHLSTTPDCGKAWQLRFFRRAFECRWKQEIKGVRRNTVNILDGTNQPEYDYQQFIAFWIGLWSVTFRQGRTLNVFPNRSEIQNIGSTMFEMTHFSLHQKKRDYIAQKPQRKALRLLQFYDNPKTLADKQEVRIMRGWVNRWICVFLFFSLDDCILANDKQKLYYQILITQNSNVLFYNWFLDEPWYYHTHHSSFDIY